MAPVILEMDVHCIGCAKKILKAIENYLGVERVWASPETGLVVVVGTADATALKRRIRSKMRRSVTIVSDGTVEPNDGAVPGWGMPPPHPYAPQTAGYPYATGNHWTTPHPRQHAPNGTPTCFDDEDEAPPADTCCSIQ